jgi:type VI secretion system protein ImpJ
MKNAQRVVWSEGMFMSPHHLQQQDLYHENLLDLRLAAVEPYPWGVASVEFDMEALRAGRVQLRQFSGVLPDGMPLSFLPARAAGAGRVPGRAPRAQRRGELRRR